LFFVLHRSLLNKEYVYRKKESEQKKSLDTFSGLTTKIKEEIKIIAKK
jgi:hypothetical protein